MIEFERVCLAEIRSEKIRFAVLDYLEKHCRLDFYTAPASSSGGRHPEWQSLPGGILMNTVECCIGADRKIRMYPSLTTENAEPRDEVHDAVYVATILSDTFKTADFGKPWDEWEHHISAAEEWRIVAGKHGIDRDAAERIASAIRWHLGRFTTDWPKGQDPRSLDPIAFIVHELDMDFANRRLSEVFQRRLGEVSGQDSGDFLGKEFESAAAYFQHVEGKLNSLLVFFATLLIAVITACYYIGSTDMFRSLGFTETPRAFLVSFLLIAFAIIGLVFIGVYTELRVRKIRMLEEMAAIRGYQIDAAARAGLDISRAITMVSSIPKCPPYLRRPSEDWYTLLLITASSAASLAVALPFVTFEVAFALGHPSLPHADVIWGAEGVTAFLVAGYLEFAWFTRFCFDLDMERQSKFARAEYVFFSKHGQSFPWPLRPLDLLATWIERRRREKRSRNDSSTGRKISS
jgi:hypothetical protein